MEFVIQLVCKALARFLLLLNLYASESFQFWAACKKIKTSPVWRTGNKYNLLDKFDTPGVQVRVLSKLSGLFYTTSQSEEEKEECSRERDLSQLQVKAKSGVIKAPQQIPRHECERKVSFQEAPCMVIRSAVTWAAWRLHFWSKEFRREKMLPCSHCLEREREPGPATCLSQLRPNSTDRVPARLLEQDVIWVRGSHPSLSWFPNHSSAPAHSRGIPEGKRGTSSGVQQLFTQTSLPWTWAATAEFGVGGGTAYIAPLVQAWVSADEGHV